MCKMHRKNSQNIYIIQRAAASFCTVHTARQAIKTLINGFQEGNQFQTLLGVTGSGKTFTMANVIAALNKPTLVISHNKTLAAQLYGEFKEYFPENAVEYFVSYLRNLKFESTYSACLCYLVHILWNIWYKWTG